jgi:DNA-binding NarL/FixJ family response regulator
MIRILLVEDHEVVRDGLASFLKEDDEIRVAGEASNGKEAMDKLNAGLNVDLVLLDLNMPVMNGQETLKYIRSHFKDLKVLILSMLEHENYVQEIMDAGASGYALKSIGKAELILAIKKVIKGQMYISSEINFRRIRKQDGEKMALDPPQLFSQREMEVLLLIAEGLTNQEIAERLYTSRRTVETHRQNLIKKTSSKNTAALIRFAINYGLIR